MRQAGAVAVDMGVVQASAITLELKAVGQLILRGKDFGVQVVLAVVE